MNPGLKLGAYGLLLTAMLGGGAAVGAAAAAFGFGLGVGDAAGPFGDSPAEQHAPEHDTNDAPADPHGWHGGSEDQQ